jgi:hypothetical protein
VGCWQGCCYASNRKDHLARHLRSREHNFGLAEGAPQPCPVCDRLAAAKHTARWFRQVRCLARTLPSITK